MAPQQSTERRQYAIGGRPLSWILLLIGAVLMFIAACVADGAHILDTPALAWAFWALSAWMLSGVV